MTETKQELAILIAQLVKKPVEPAAVQKVLETVTADPQRQQRILQQLKRLVAWPDDPAWLELIAAYQEGVTVPQMADFLAARAILAEIAPELKLPFDQLEALPPAADDFLGDFPTFAEQWTQQQLMETTGWVRALNYEWQQVRATGNVIIRWLNNLNVTLAPPLTPLAVKGQIQPTEADELVQRITLSQAEVEDLELEAVIRRSRAEPEQCLLVVSAQVPSRWPELAGLQVQASAGAWQAEGVTNGDGEVIFSGIPLEALDTLVIEVRPNQAV